jgi:hypothetical protein
MFLEPPPNGEEGHDVALSLRVARHLGLDAVAMDSIGNM